MGADFARLPLEMFELDERTDIESLVLRLMRAMGALVIDLRYIHGQWCVMVDKGNAMVVVPGSHMETPRASLLYCLHRWKHRSVEHPFLEGEK